jgi:hypothetical protein
VQHDQGLTRSVDEVRLYSGVWQNFVATGARVHYESWNGPWYREANSAAFPGVLPWALAFVAIASGVAWRDRRARMWLAIGVVGAALSFGPALPGYAVLYDALPILQGIRAVARFALLTLLAVGVLAAFGLSAVRARLAAGNHRRPSTVLGLIAVIGVNVENARAPMTFVTADAVPPIYAALRSEPAAIIDALPFPEPARVAANAAAVYASTAHWRPLLNGYSGYTPRSYVEHYLAFKDFPDPSAIDAMRSAGVTHLVVDILKVPDAVAALQQVDGVQLIGSDARRRIYRIVGRAPSPKGP